MNKVLGKPVIIEAIQMDYGNDSTFEEIKTWLNENGAEFDTLVTTDFTSMKIKTLDGDHIVSDRDFIIKGIKGEFYPCKPDIFKKTHELVEVCDE